ncbi:deoxyuridine 5'-triphosphate nucleotidohydrolase Dut [Leptolyngbya boryana NIES-2135]|jgi:dUTP pyrophosphatase|uniref:Deoxyuridine 5'-triphosphate nucleotidohydrolase n=1 Tax=Leptolyngbya boryana NIES-2135 TaxID=1973484 RepID=A0A1Z4JK20_LEPBY|nr:MULTISPECIES: dUTP diphosphatase [Leptolyngbya]BAY57099.1 deoxyuridine 5'-triphosphate nucleotidohydrolase Dut [Leptolyngbya boryana NIES-2135]MBD2367147.1 dUTP diphosphatase [Leptolyngbya sp. FACHB-161]MBD2373499.1 dUTP diphosphatase [Leptolyngbya sp. FACHB-238]MBD2397908.1 dUTP diphosphatase [Leptolyngbya sp. FACHB-239]MBD2404409.1 dUTP diphosphatase [Leptolyngbya sp. FACHB-402]
MQSAKVKLVKLVDSAKLPRYEHEDDSGLDLFALEEQDIPPGKTALIGTGIAIELPLGTEAQIRPRSGLALKHSITVLNTPGTVDAGYRGEIGVILINHGQESFKVLKHMKIAQMVIVPVIRAELEEVDRLSDTIRGAGGFGSTGV